MQITFGTNYFKPEGGKMKKWMISYTFIAILIGGCATSGDLEELGVEMKKNHETLCP